MSENFKMIQFVCLGLLSFALGSFLTMYDRLLNQPPIHWGLCFLSISVPFLIGALLFTAMEPEKAKNSRFCAMLISVGIVSVGLWIFALIRSISNYAALTFTLSFFVVLVYFGINYNEKSA